MFKTIISSSRYQLEIGKQSSRRLAENTHNSQRSDRTKFVIWSQEFWTTQKMFPRKTHNRLPSTDRSSTSRILSALEMKTNTHYSSLDISREYANFWSLRILTQRKTQLHQKNDMFQNGTSLLKGICNPP